MEQFHPTLSPPPKKIVLFWPTDKRVVLFELSVPFEPNIEKAHRTKNERYASLVTDIVDAGFSCTLITVEVGSRGLNDTDNKGRITRLSKELHTPTTFTVMKKHIAKSAISSSYSIFNARYEPQWNVHEFI